MKLLVVAVVMAAMLLQAASFLEQKYFEEIWTTLADSINSATVFHEAKSFGSQSGNGSWNGLMALVSSGLADIGIGMFAVTKERADVVAFTVALGYGRNNVFIRLPSSSDMAWDRYLTPFSYGLWLAVAIAVCALSVCLALTNCCHYSNQSLTVPAVLFYIQACFCQQANWKKEDLDGFKRVCDDHNYAYIGSKSFSNHFSRTVSWQVVPLPETIYPESLAFITPKNNPFKGLINWSSQATPNN